MTLPTLSVAHEVRAIAQDRAAEMCIVGEWDWWLTTRGDLLHAATVEYDPNYELAGTGVTACSSRRTFLAVPGLFSRTERPRCSRCCKRLGYPQGIGSPKNDLAVPATGQSTARSPRRPRTMNKAPSRLCPHCAQPFTPGRHNQRFCDALCKRWFGKRLSRLRLAARSERG